MAKKSRRFSLTSAANRILNPERTKPPAREIGAEALYDLYSNLGQIRAALEFKSMAASKVQYYPARKVDPRADPEPVDDGPAVEAFEQLQGVQGEFADFVAEAVIHFDVAGEGYLVGWDAGEDGEEREESTRPEGDEWDIISAVEYQRATQGGYQRKDSAIRAITAQDYVLRLWRPHPMLREFPNSSLASVRAECEQYLLLRGMITSVAQSRLMMGILRVSDNLSLPPKANGEETDEFFDVFYEALEAAIREPDSAARVMPVVVQGSTPDGESAFEFLDMARDLPEWVPALMERVLRQIATGLDLPADILLGLADVNHWTAWLSEDSAKLDYVDPLVLLILESLSRGYLRPFLEASGVADAGQYLFWRDYSDLIARSVGSADAMALYDRNIISADAARRTVGFTEADAPEEVETGGGEVIEFPAGPDTVTRGVPGTETPAASFMAETADDIAKRVSAAGILIRSGFDPEASLEAVGLPSIEHLGLLPVTVKDNQQLPSVSPVEEITEAITAAAEMPKRGRPTAQATASALTAATRPKSSLGDIDHRLYAQISETAQAALDRALERAGQKIRSHATGDPRKPPKHPSFAAAIDGVPNRLVGQTLGEGVKEVFQLTDDDLIPEDTFTRTGERVERILQRGQDETYRAVSELTGVTPERDEERERTWREVARDFLIGALVGLALHKLFTPDLEPDPAETGEVEDTQIPAPVIFDTLTIAGGGTPGQGPQVPRGLANGEQTQNWVVEAGFQIREREWTVGAPAMPFEPHRNLRGVRFSEWTDPQLSTPSHASWLGVGFMFPGDHRGCQCVAELVVAEAEDMFPPIAASG